jgi:hypothetical protein
MKQREDARPNTRKAAHMKVELNYSPTPRLPRSKPRGQHATTHNTLRVHLTTSGKILEGQTPCHGHVTWRHSNLKAQLDGVRSSARLGKPQKMLKQVPPIDYLEMA